MKEVKFDYYLKDCKLDINFPTKTITTKVRKITIHLKDVEDEKVLEMNNRSVNAVPNGDLTFNFNL